MTKLLFERYATPNNFILYLCFRFDYFLFPLVRTVSSKEIKGYDVFKYVSFVT